MGKVAPCFYPSDSKRLIYSNRIVNALSLTKRTVYILSLVKSWHLLMAYLAHDQSNLPVHDVYMQLRYISDLILENQLSCHIWYFKKYQFQILKPLLFSCARL